MRKMAKRSKRMHGQNDTLRFLVKEANDELLRLFERKSIPYSKCCIAEASATYDGGNCKL